MPIPQSSPEVEHTLFLPGRFSYPQQDDPADHLYLVASPASLWRAHVGAEVAAGPVQYGRVVCAGGYSDMMVRTNPHWPRDPMGNYTSKPWIPDPEKGEMREADLMAEHFAEVTDRLRQTMGRGYMGEVCVQNQSSTSLGDVRLSIGKDRLDPDKYADDPRTEVHLGVGAAHGKRFIKPLAIGLDISPQRIRRVRMHDKNGMPKTQFLPAESAQLAYLKEQAAGVIQSAVLRSVKPGDLDGLRRADEDFIRMTSSPKEAAKVLRHHPAALLDAMGLTRHVHSRTVEPAGRLALAAA